MRGKESPCSPARRQYTNIPAGCAGKEETGRTMMMVVMLIVMLLLRGVWRLLDDREDLICSPRLCAPCF